MTVEALRRGRPEVLADHRIAIQFACAGLGSVNVEFAGLSSDDACMADDQSWAFVQGDGPTREVGGRVIFDPVAGPADDRVVPLHLNVDPGVAWRVAVYDLGPDDSDPQCRRHGRTSRPAG